MIHKLLHGLLAATILWLVPLASAQVLTNPNGVTLTPATFQTAGLQGSGATCSVISACLQVHLPINANGAAITLAGTFSATAQFEESGDNQITWPTNVGSSSTVGLTTVSFTGITDIRVRLSAYTSGTVIATINITLNTGLTGPTGPAGGVVNGSGTSPLGASFNIKASGAIGDAKASVHSTTANLSNSVTSTDNPWLSTDVGKHIFCVGQGAGNASSSLTPVIETIASFVSAGSITVSGVGNSASGGSNSCVWFTQKETTAIKAAVSAALASLTAIDLNTGGPMLAYTSTVYCPPGGYVIDGPAIVEDNQVGGNHTGISFIGAGRTSCILYLSPDLVPGSSGDSANAYAIDFNNANGVTFSGFSIWGSGFLFSNANVSLIRLSNVARGHFYDFDINQFGSNLGSTDTVFVTGGGSQLFEQMSFQGVPSGDNHIGFACSGAGGISIVNSLMSNTGQRNATFGSCGSRSPTGSSVNIVGGTIDETSGAYALELTSGSVVNEIGVENFGGTSAAVHVCGTCSLYISSSDVGSFNSAGNIDGILIDSGGFAESTGSTLRGNGTGHVVNAVAAATFVDDGGNLLQNCTSTTCSNVTPATFTSQGYTGGIVPTASVTHTPNTCYAVTGNLLATAQNICTILLDQNYQLKNITAQSGGTTPVNSSCATPPVITLSDGTRSATMTMTTGKTQWSSNVDAVTNINQIFASGATLTVSIGANTCATPPANVSVNWTIQSAINF